VPRVTVDDASLFYRGFGSRRERPVVLIHGATSDGMTDWGAIAPVLGLRHRVIVLDCRGHGRSTNPAGGYSFSRMASDVAGLVRSLGVDRAHIVGHSNGGNVALVLAVEHPGVVASCVVQAANAFVSRDLIEREPALFDPDRVERDSPGWRDRMIRLHGRWHGRTYWRDLLTITVREIMASPNYTPADLASVSPPVLVIEGREDPVNAPSGHGAFIAANVPDCELWRPEGVGHTVHEERPAAWLERVQDFWFRRGTETRDRLWRLGSGVYRDRRSTVFDVALPHDADSRSTVTVLDPDQAKLLSKEFGHEHLAVRVLRRRARRATIRVGVADVRSEPTDDAERVTQGLFGEEVDSLETTDAWRRVQLVADGYVGWVRDRAIELSGGLPREPTHRVVSDHANAFETPGDRLVMRLPMGATLSVVAEAGDWVEVLGCRDRTMWVRRADTLPLGEPLARSGALERFRLLIGVPYLWGGRTPWGFDCSGLSQAFMKERGIAVPRDADQQWAAGTARRGQPQQGDLLFFSVPGSNARTVDHVAIALGGQSFLHASGAAGAVTINSLDRTSSEFSPELIRSLLGARTHTSD